MAPLEKIYWASGIFGVGGLILGYSSKLLLNLGMATCFGLLLAAMFILLDRKDENGKKKKKRKK
jgi:hypothetical protein